MPVRHTHEEYVKILQETKPHINVLDNYVNNRTKLLHYCKKHQIEFYNDPFSVMRNSGCPKCCNENKSQSKTKTHEQYLEEIKEKQIQVIPLEQYNGTGNKIKHLCLIHNKEFMVSPNEILSRRVGCSQCTSERKTKAFTKTHEQYLLDLKKFNPNIIPLEKYVNEKTKILHKCLICEFEWKVRPNNVLTHKGCPKCNKHIVKSHDDFINIVQQNNPEIEILETFLPSQLTIKCKCRKHNIIWNANVESILRGGGCHLCGKEKASLQLKKTQEQFLNELKEKHFQIIPLEEYKGDKAKIRFKCLKCSYEWITSAHIILHGRGCLRCNQSIGEKKVEQWLLSRNIQYESQKRFEDCIDIKPLPFDFYLPTYIACIEFDGEQHFKAREFFGGQEAYDYLHKHDIIKTKYCQDNNIPLLRIPYYANVEEELEKFLLN